MRKPALKLTFVALGGKKRLFVYQRNS